MILSRLILLLIILIVNSKGQNLPEFKLLKTGFYHASDVSAHYGEEWIGLFYGHEYSELRRVSVLRKEPSHTFPRNPDGVIIEIDDEQDPILLINPQMAFEMGPVTTAFMGWRIAFWEPDTFVFNFNEYSYEFRVSMRKLSGPEHTSHIYNNYDYFVEVFEHLQGMSQRLFYYENCCKDKYPNLIWAGDIDRDNKLDFLYDRSGHNLRSDLRLCLSSFAEPGDLYKEVAQFKYSTGD